MGLFFTLATLMEGGQILFGSFYSLKGLGDGTPQTRKMFSINVKPRGGGEGVHPNLLGQKKGILMAQNTIFSLFSPLRAIFSPHWSNFNFI